MAFFSLINSFEKGILNMNSLEFTNLMGDGMLSNKSPQIHLWMVYFLGSAFQDWRYTASQDGLRGKPF